MPIIPSAYALVTTSFGVVGVARFEIKLFIISSAPRIVVIPFTSSKVIGADVCMPILPEESVKRLRTDVPMVPEGGLAKVHATNNPDHASINIKILLGILISVPRRTTL